MTTFTKGDRVQFTSKYGDIVDGIYEGIETTPHATLGGVRSAVVLSDNAFGPDSPKGVRCLVPPVKLRRV